VTDLTPVAVEEHIRQLANRIAGSASVCADRYAAFLNADHEFDTAFARAYMRHDGPQQEKRYAATLATEAERSKRDTADAAYRYADRLAKALEAELRAYQSLGASIRTQYAIAGRGES